MLKCQYKPWSFICQCKLEDGQTCGCGFLNRSGLTQHVNAKHCVFATITANPDKGGNDVNTINANWDNPNDKLMEMSVGDPL
jgi:hypothetical protein